MNKYINKIQKDFDNAKWDARLKNYDSSPFPQVLSDKLEIKPKQDKSEFLILVNKHRANKLVQHQTILHDTWLLPTNTKKAFALFLNKKLASIMISSARNCNSTSVINTDSEYC